MIKPPAGRPADLVNEGTIAGQRIAKISVVTLVSIGIAQIIVGQLSGSVVATADGIDSLSDAMISFIVLIGLRIVHRPGHRKFPFGYRKVESFSAHCSNRYDRDRRVHPLVSDATVPPCTG